MQKFEFLQQPLLGGLAMSRKKREGEEEKKMPCKMILCFCCVNWYGTLNTKLTFYGLLSWGDTDPRVDIVRYMGDHGRICHFRDIYPSFRVYPSFIPYNMENFGHIRHFSHIYPSFQAVPSPMPCNKLTSTSSSVSSLFFHFQIKKWQVHLIGVRLAGL